ncbi:Gfo/Idh/MocA family oxidoreductase [Flavobacteriaceae bacterium TP-CH-4]|uniref:Gfo/Idh/MocA family oxidoreductase n=1 Tax=Pelagihabitans pacificus TaxID=2696054 RepID=A0A967E694_9FLAO|nr:Gfo/Idh/MocA family oxidoreductase [Pelagihabitans pacificus]NHF58939.1 Gfo/Idh/MocA family oxidoreductase [Pelagihabitans pacificus]
MKKPINIGIIGTQFMGKAHSNAYLRLPHFFDLAGTPVMHTACGRNEAQLGAFSEKYGWQHQLADWKTLVQNDEIDLLDICTPNNLHHPIALEALKNGKHVLCEKPMAMNVREATEMVEAAETAGVVHMMIFNYRFVPALALAKKLIDSGKLGTVHHFNAVYYQDWLVDPTFPIVWRHDAKTTGSGAHGDMNAHIVDLARFLVGEFEAVTGVQEVFVKERPLKSGSGMGKVTADDATLFLARFRNGALGSFNATRFANGCKNYLRLEIFGSKGSLCFNLERLNELQYFNLDDAKETQGFTTILVTEKDHPFIDAWWPPGHIIGWEHSFVHQFATLINGIAADTKVVPNFYDGLRCQHVLDAVTDSAQKKRWISIKD